MVAVEAARVIFHACLQGRALQGRKMDPILGVPRLFSRAVPVAINMDFMTFSLARVARHPSFHYGCGAAMFRARLVAGLARDGSHKRYARPRGRQPLSVRVVNPTLKKDGTTIC